MGEPSAMRRQGSRDQILHAAGEVFLKTGFARSSIDMVAAAAHVSKQSIYELFPSKEALFEAAVRWAINDTHDNFASVRESGDMRETLAAYGAYFFDGFAGSMNFGLFRANISAATISPKLAGELHHYRLGMARKIGLYLARLQAQKRLREADPLSAAIRFGGVAVSGSRYFLGAPFPAAAARKDDVEAAINLFLQGYRSQNESPAVEASEPVPEPVLEGARTLRLSSEKFARLTGAAMTEFRDKGYVATSMERIAKDVGSSKATIYRQFGSKEGLFRYLIEREIYMFSRSDFAVPPEGGLEEAIADLAQQALERHIAPSSILMQRMLIEESQFVADLARRFYDTCVATLGRTLYQLLVAHGWPAPNAATQRAFFTLATFGVRFLTVQPLPDKAWREQLSQECAQFFLHGYGRIEDLDACAE